MITTNYDGRYRPVYLLDNSPVHRSFQNGSSYKNVFKCYWHKLKGKAKRRTQRENNECERYIPFFFSHKNAAKRTELSKFFVSLLLCTSCCLRWRKAADSKSRLLQSWWQWSKNETIHGVSGITAVYKVFLSIPTPSFKKFKKT